jgi:hypothetical protein
MLAPKLSDEQILLVCRELLHTNGPQTSLREVQLALRQRYSAVGKTTRLLCLWRTLTQEQTPPTPPDPSEFERLRARTLDAERIARSALDEAEAAVRRAEISEERERAHQDHWALQIDELRQKLAQYQDAFRRTADLENRNLALHRQVAALRARVAELETPGVPVLEASV